MKAAKIRLEVHKAHHGDALLVSLEYSQGRRKHIMIDGGTEKTFDDDPSGLYKELDQIQKLGEYIDLLIITHYDSDHIGGILKMYEEGRYRSDFVKKVWFNSGEEYPIPIQPPKGRKVSAEQGYNLQKHLKVDGSWTGKEPILRLKNYADLEKELGVKITVLSPDPEHMPNLQKHWDDELRRKEIKVSRGRKAKDWDYGQKIEELAAKKFEQEDSDPNGASIAILLEAGDKRLLLLGDSWPGTVIESLESLGYSSDNPLKVDYVKLSHHGSKGNLNEKLLELIDCVDFIVSTDGKRFKHPDKECLARIIMDHVRKGNEKELIFYFNHSRKEYYDILKVDGEDIKQRYNFDIIIKREYEPWVFEV